MAFYIGFYAFSFIVHTRADQLLPQLLMEQFDTFPIQCRHIEHRHEGVWFRKNNFWQNDSCEYLDNFSMRGLLYMHWWCLHGPINIYHSFWWKNLILCLYNVDTLNICMKEFCSEKIIFDKMTAYTCCAVYFCSLQPSPNVYLVHPQNSSNLYACIFRLETWRSQLIWINSVFINE